MERAGRVLAKLKLAAHGVTDEQLARAAWGVAVGKTIARRTQAVGLVRTRLIVEVEDQIWQRQLFGLRRQIVEQLEKALGQRIVEELEFRVGIPKRAPGREEAAAAPALLTDEADGIRDPVFRSIYKASRRRATA